MWARSAFGSGARVGRAASIRRRGRAPFLILAVVALLAGLWGALARLGLPVAAPSSLPGSHGLLMTMGFLGTVISLERAVALGRRSAFLAPALAGIGGISCIVGVPACVWVLVAAGIAFAATCGYMWRVRSDVPTFAMLLGALAWAAAAIAIAFGTPIAKAVPLLASFLVLTVTGERVGLSRVAHPPSWSAPAFVGASALLLAGAAAGLVDASALRVAGLGLIALSAWLARWDIAWRNIRRGGVTRYMAVALVTGYGWLAAGGIAWVMASDPPTIFAYDALIHTVFVGFVLSMIFAHELMIVPALLGTSIPFTRAFYVPLGLLHGSLAVRIAGDVAGDVGVWQWAGTTNVIAVLLFAGVTVASARGLASGAQPRVASLRPT